MVKLVILLSPLDTEQVNPNVSYNDMLMQLEAIPTVRRKAVSTTWGGPAGIPFDAIIELYFDHRLALEEALTTPEGTRAGQTVLAFAPNAVIFFADVMEESFDSSDLAPGEMA
ncbi:MAG: hypothetical protein GYB68_09890 [Chloroflexi bacterium]|nr:hypothetical protein [Chloroflexota bacterium]